ncbi:MAG: hypothetical protein MJ105_03155 [Lachnospiraceae bacterium]|nr:hypothetical protein [Lachnospiraceae bacterium]
MEESWGLKNLLDRADDVAMFVVGVRDEKVLYCNHFCAMHTRLHPGTKVKDVFADWGVLLNELGESMSGRFVLVDTPFGKDRSITLSRMVWTGGVQAIGVLVTPHKEAGAEEETQMIYKSLGESYEWMFILDAEKSQMRQVIRPKDDQFNLYQPLDFDEWKRSRYFPLVQQDDYDNVFRIFELGEIFRRVSDSNGRYSVQLRRRFGQTYHWVECTFRRMEGLGDKRIVVTEKDIQGELSMTQKSLENEMILKSLSNIYRSIYLLDLKSGEFQTVKSDEFLYGISETGDYNYLLGITAEMISNEEQKKDLKEYFSLEAIIKAFQDDKDNIGREYSSLLIKDGGWMSINAFRPPHLKSLENKCVLTFADITEHKRVEAERNEKNIALDVLSSRYMALFFATLYGQSFHSIKVPAQYAYLEKQYPTILEAFNYYISAYVLEPYREMLRNIPQELKPDEDGETSKYEYIYRNIDNQWIRLNIFMIPREGGETELIIAMEDYDDIMEQYALSSVYNATMLNDYESMYEYDPQTDFVYQLRFDGERLVRTKNKDISENSLKVMIQELIHPDEQDMFVEACSYETVKECVDEGKTVTHMCFRKKDGETYRSFMYGFHYFKEFESPRVMIMVRDGEKELM